MNNFIHPCLWFDGNAKDAADFYCSIFNNSKVTANTPLVVNFEIEGIKIMGLNGGPMFKINPSISLFITCETDDEIETLWQKLSDGGSTMMTLQKYPWSEKYGWLVDKFGMTWQLMLGKLPLDGQKIVSSLLFVGTQYGKAQEAINHYTSIFKNSFIHFLDIYKDGEEQPEGNLKFGYFSLDGVQFAAMDGIGDHNFKFNEAVSFVVECNTQEEIDYYWEHLISNGGAEVQCGWLLDKFGVSWQIIPKSIASLVTNPENGSRAMQAMMKMKKINIEALKNA